MRRRLATIVGAALIALAPLGAGPKAQELVADLSRHLVGITTGFAGTDVLLFGSTEGKGDVVIVVRGPPGKEVVRRKARIAGIWVNDAELEFEQVPAYYAIAASRPIDELLTPYAMRRHGIGTENLRLRPARASGEEFAAFRAALVRNKVRQGLFRTEPVGVTFLGQRLFRSTMYFPANVPTGTYTVQVFLIRDGEVASAQTTPLLIAKVGIGADIYQFAHRSSALYGIIAVVMALFAGWFAGAVFRRV